MDNCHQASLVGDRALNQKAIFNVLFSILLPGNGGLANVGDCHSTCRMTCGDKEVSTILKYLSRKIVEIDVIG